MAEASVVRYLVAINQHSLPQNFVSSMVVERNASKKAARKLHVAKLCIVPLMAAEFVADLRDVIESL